MQLCSHEAGWHQKITAHFSLIAFVPHRFPATTTSDHGCEASATKRAGSCSLSVECGNRRLKHRQGNLKFYTRQDSLWFCQCPPRHDQSKILIGPCCSLLANSLQDSVAYRTDYIDLGLACADVCKALDRGMNGRQADWFSRSVFEAIEQLTT